MLYSDADLPFDMEEVPRAIRLLRQYDADIVSAYRFDRTGEGYTRAIYTFFYNLLIRTMFGVKARDINFAFKLLPPPRPRHDRAAQRGLVHRRRADHPGDPRSGFELLQFGVDYFPRTRGESTLSSPASSRTILARDGPALRGELQAHRPVAPTLDDRATRLAAPARIAR